MLDASMQPGLGLLMSKSPQSQLIAGFAPPCSFRCSMLIFVYVRFGASLYPTIFSYCSIERHNAAAAQNLAPINHWVVGVWSGRADLNRGPPAPEPGALPGFATPGHNQVVILPYFPRLLSVRVSSTVPSLSPNSCDLTGFHRRHIGASNYDVI